MLRCGGIITITDSELLAWATAGAAVAFKGKRNHDSVAVLGEPGAEALPAVPGRCLVKRGETVEVQAYACGLEGGRFDAFLASLPRQLPQPVAKDAGIPVDDWPTTERLEPVVDGCERLQAGRAPTAEQAEQWRRLHAAGWSLTRLCFEAYGYKDGVVFGYVRDAIGGAV